MRWWLPSQVKLLVSKSKACEKISPKITDEEVRLVEEDTRRQSKGSCFYCHRAGRIGASISKAARMSAIEAYEKIIKEKHINFQVTKCGTFINKQYPWLHATPDVLCRCDCCGEGCDQMPFCLKDIDLEQYIKKYNSCLNSENGDASLKREHAYYYQTHEQIFTAE